MGVYIMDNYYNAYEKRYKQVHEKNCSWASKNPSPIVLEIIKKYNCINSKILELGCGEGRDANFLLENGYNVLATDVSKEAINYCKSINVNNEKSFIVLDACSSNLNGRFDFIYSVAVIHMLVLQKDRDKFLSFIKNHLNKNGKALILTMGDGEYEMETNIEDAFKDTKRVHTDTGKEMMIASTSCKMVSFKHFEEELLKNDLRVVEKGITCIEPDFPTIMYAVVE